MGVTIVVESGNGGAMPSRTPHSTAGSPTAFRTPSQPPAEQARAGAAPAPPTTPGSQSGSAVERQPISSSPTAFKTPANAPIAPPKGGPPAGTPQQPAVATSPCRRPTGRDSTSAGDFIADRIQNAVERSGRLATNS